MKDDELTKELKFIVERERRNLSVLLIHLAEYDDRRLFKNAGYPSLFMYCVKALGYDENGAFRRITAGRVIKHYPSVCALVASGELTMTALLVLSPVLTDENHDRLFKEARGKTRREIEMIAAGLCPQPSRSDFIRRHPAAYPAWTPPAAPSVSGSSDSARQDGSAPAALPPPTEPPSTREWQAVIPISLDRVRIGFDAAISVLRLLERAQQVLRHKYPQGRVEDIMREALEILLDRKDPQRKFALKTPPAAIARDAARPAESERLRSGPPLNASNEPRFLRAWKNGRYIPARVKSAVWQRDDGRCAWRLEDGAVCGAKDWLEYDHVRPYAQGGRSDDPRNVRLLCRLHNQAAATAGLTGPKPAPTSV